MPSLRLPTPPRRPVTFAKAAALAVATCLVWSTAGSPAAEPGEARPGKAEPGTAGPAGIVFPAAVTAYDVATPRELFYRRHVAPSVAGAAVAEWPVWQGLEAEVGGWIGPYLEAAHIAETITDAFPLGEQPATREIDRLVADCAKILSLPKPEVFLKNDPRSLAYVTQADGRPMLTLTSGLVALHAGRPAELRFAVGRELGRIRCGHVEEQTKAHAVYAALRAVNVAAVPDEFQLVLPTLALGRLMSFLREAEFSADRAGLLCCQDLAAAHQAIFRQLHGLPADSPAVDPSRPDFDPSAYLAAVEYWEDKPLVRLIREAKKFSAEQPFVPERVAQLSVWAASDAYREILARADAAAGPDPGQLVTVRSVTVVGAADADGDADPYVIAFSGGDRLFATAAAAGKKSARWRDVDVTRAVADGQPIFFEVWDDDWGADRFVGGFVVYPRNPRDPANPRRAYRASLEWDWKGRAATSRQGFGQVVLEFSSRAGQGESE